MQEEHDKEIELQAETDMGTALLPTAYLLALGFLRKRGHRVLRGSTKCGSQGRLLMRHVDLSNGRHHNERLV